MTRRNWLIAMAAGWAAFSLPGIAHAPPFCAPTVAMLEALAVRYGERPAGAGVTVDGALLQLLIRPDMQSWTVLLTRPDGVSCLLAVGHDWQARAAVPGESL